MTCGRVRDGCGSLMWARHVKELTAQRSPKVLPSSLPASLVCEAAPQKNRKCHLIHLLFSQSDFTAAESIHVNL